MKGPIKLVKEKLESKIAEYNSYSHFASKHPVLHEICATFDHLDDLRTIAKTDGIIPALKYEGASTWFRFKSAIYECEYIDPPKLAKPSMPESLVAKYSS
ncbi:hypothetical protein ISS09_02270 [Candidatus Woesearchaeota archaeon]|nr:hypothetical protein [Candidatus Woesearchaeota archaeon]